MLQEYMRRCLLGIIESAKGRRLPKMFRKVSRKSSKSKLMSKDQEDSDKPGNLDPMTVLPDITLLINERNYLQEEVRNLRQNLDNEHVRYTKLKTLKCQQVCALTFKLAKAIRDKERESEGKDETIVSLQQKIKELEVCNGKLQEKLTALEAGDSHKSDDRCFKQPSSLTELSCVVAVGVLKTMYDKKSNKHTEVVESESSCSSAPVPQDDVSDDSLLDETDFPQEIKEFYENMTCINDTDIENSEVEFKKQLEQALKELEGIRADNKEIKQQMSQMRRCSADHQDFLRKTTDFTGKILNEMKEREEQRSQRITSVCQPPPYRLQPLGTRLDDIVKAANDITHEPVLTANETSLVLSSRPQSACSLPAHSSFIPQKPSHKIHGKLSDVGMYERKYLTSGVAGLRKISMPLAKEWTSSESLSKNNSFSGSLGYKDYIHRHIVTSSSAIAKIRDLTPEELAYKGRQITY